MQSPSHEPQQSWQIYAKIDKIFTEANITPTPLNFVVWYQYFLSENHHLVNEINALPEGAKSYTDRFGRRLYDDYIDVAESPQETEYNMAVQKFVDNILHKMDGFSEGMQSHTNQIDQYAKGLDANGLTADHLQEIAKQIMAETNHMQQCTAEIHNEVKNSSEEVKELRQQLKLAKQEALTDELTQIGNRKAFNSAIQELTVDFHNQPHSLCLIITDIDHFKSFNDTYGHPVGDSVLRYYANILKKDSHQGEAVCRYGGEEFAILIKDSSIEKASQRAEQIRQQIEAVKLTLKDSNEPIRTITASFGVSHFKGEEDSIEAFIERADQSLYAAKEAGRNQVIHENMVN